MMSCIHSPSSRILTFLLLFFLPLTNALILPNVRWRNRGITASTAKITTFGHHEARPGPPSPRKPLFALPSIADDDVKIGGRDIVSHVTLLHDSLKKLTGMGLYERMCISDEAIKSKSDIYNYICLNDRFVLISHGTEEDPIYNFGNVACLEAFVRTWDDLITIPSRESVVFQSTDEELRKELMRKVTNDGYVEGATGIRVRGDGKFIRLVDAVVWNCYDGDGTYSGQAALFDKEKCPILSSIDEE